MSIRNCSYVVNEDFVTIVADHKPYNIQSDHPRFEEVKVALKNRDFEKAVDLCNTKKQVEEFIKPTEEKHMGLGIEVRENYILYNGAPMHNTLTRQILDMIKGGYDVNPLMNFLYNLVQNPSKTSVDELYGFLESNNTVSITPDGCFLAYKRVRSDYKDIHSGTFDNSVGMIHEMPRNQVDDNRNQTCSSGFHFCSYSYLFEFYSSQGEDDHVMIVKINPADVVSIPSDYNNAKGRCSKYEVVDEVKDWVKDSREFLVTPVVDAYDEEDDERDSDEVDFCVRTYVPYSLDRVNVESTKTLLDNVETMNVPYNLGESENNGSVPTAQDFRAMSNRMSIIEMALMFNKVTGSNIKKFTDRKTAIRRLSAVLPQN